MRLLAALALLPFLQDKDTGEQFYKFKVGTSWTLAQTETQGEKVKETTIDLKVVKEDGGKIHLESKETKADGKTKDTTLVWWCEDGALLWGEVKGEEVKAELRFYKVGSKKGDTWEATAGKGDPPNAKATHMGTTEVKVPAGTYKDALHVQITMEGGTINMYWGPNVGILKMEGEMGGGMAKMSIELKEFKEAK